MLPEDSDCNKRSACNQQSLCCTCRYLWQVIASPVLLHSITRILPTEAEGQQLWGKFAANAAMS